ncbi:MAG TPA: phosphoenolpyruvate carboxykinase (ATP) [Acidimicrobiia bacterium]|nr:phosphoenolpyruvate carboxykinase (ATP) [Acidimicrobiia bacterium]
MEIRARSVLFAPEAAEPRRLTAAQPIAHITEHGNYDIVTRVTARSKGSTFIVSDEPHIHTDPVIDRDAYQVLAKRQDDFIATRDMIALDGYIGDHPTARMRTRLVVEASNANLAAMQQLLYFPADDDAEPELTVFYTPNLGAPGFPDDRAILVDLDNGVTRVFNADYFGESKMGGLRMWDAAMYRRGGLAMHSGLKLVGDGAARRAGLVVGLSGTGKTTTTFSTAGGGAPVQDDYVALFPGGKVYGTEAGTFAKVYGLTPQSEPAVWHGATQARSYLENVAIDSAGKLDWFDRTHTENSRAVIAGADIPGFIAPANVERADFMLILNRNASIVPAVTRLTRDQAAAYFMLGETQGTSAGGVAEAGKALRVPGTNPFFAYRHEWQGNRLREILDTCELEVFVLNTGRVGGGDGDERSRKITPAVSAAIVSAITHGGIEWVDDPDFGYQVAAAVPGVADAELLQPRLLYQRQQRSSEYAELVATLHRERREHLAGYRDLLPEIAAAV